MREAGNRLAIGSKPMRPQGQRDVGLEMGAVAFLSNRKVRARTTPSRTTTPMREITHLTHRTLDGSRHGAIPLLRIMDTFVPLNWGRHDALPAQTVTLPAPTVHRIRHGCPDAHLDQRRNGGSTEPGGTSPWGGASNLCSCHFMPQPVRDQRQGPVHQPKHQPVALAPKILTIKKIL